MAESKIYLAVPFAEKDAAKALGARWDPALKKWYVTAGKELALFAKWLTDSPAASVASPRPNAVTAAPVTEPADKDFVAYQADLPPWD